MNSNIIKGIITTEDGESHNLLTKNYVEVDADIIITNFLVKANIDTSEEYNMRSEDNVRLIVSFTDIDDEILTVPKVRTGQPTECKYILTDENMTDVDIWGTSLNATWNLEELTTTWLPWEPPDDIYNFYVNMVLQVEDWSK